MVCLNSGIINWEQESKFTYSMSFTSYFLLHHHLHVSIFKHSPPVPIHISIHQYSNPIGGITMVLQMVKGFSLQRMTPKWQANEIGKGFLNNYF